jgi:hypothetical protein
MAMLKNRIFKFMIWAVLSFFIGCDKDNMNVNLHLDSINSEKYYTSEILLPDYQAIYGKWKLVGVSGGFSGTGYEPDFDYLEIKSIGIYGLVRNDSLFEYGKLELYTFDNQNTDMLQVKFTPEFYKASNPYMVPSEKYIELKNDSLNLNAPCCDMYNYHFTKIK